MTSAVKIGDHSRSVRESEPLRIYEGRRTRPFFVNAMLLERTGMLRPNGKGPAGVQAAHPSPYSLPKAESYVLL